MSGHEVKVTELEKKMFFSRGLKHDSGELCCLVAALILRYFDQKMPSKPSFTSAICHYMEVTSA